MSRSDIKTTLMETIRLLVAKDYDAIEAMTHGTRLTASQIAAGVLEYGRTLALPPDEAYSHIDAIPIQGTSPQEYSIRFRLYTIEEGESDLELQTTFIESEADGPMRVEIDNILVA